MLIKKKLCVLLTPALILGLAACNTNNDQALDQANGNRTTPITNVDNDLYRVNNRYPFDHQGPLAEDYNRNDRNNRNGTRMIRNVRNSVDTKREQYPFDHQGPLTEDYERDNRINNGRTSFRNRVQNNVNDHRLSNGENLTISNYKTEKDSNNYPHTRAVLVQEARYEYVPVDPKLDSDIQVKLRKAHELAHSPELQQQLLKQAQDLMRQQQARGHQPQGQAQAPKTQTPAQQQAPAAPKQQTGQTPANVSQVVQQVIDLTNQQRRQHGLQPLQADAQLNRVAQLKAEDMRQKGYFSHTSPTYGSPFDMMRDFGVSYKAAAENIAQGQRTPQAVVQAWMGSQGHRENILGNYTHIGVGYDPEAHH